MLIPVYGYVLCRCRAKQLCDQYGIPKPGKIETIFSLAENMVCYAFVGALYGLTLVLNPSLRLLLGVSIILVFGVAGWVESWLIVNKGGRMPRFLGWWRAALLPKQSAQDLVRALIYHAFCFFMIGAGITAIVYLAMA
jgi:hypothetical protein